MIVSGHKYSDAGFVQLTSTDCADFTSKLECIRRVFDIRCNTEQLSCELERAFVPFNRDKSFYETIYTDIYIYISLIFLIKRISNFCSIFGAKPISDRD